MVTALDVAADKVTVTYQQGGKPRTLAADFCISTIPASILAMRKTNPPEACMAAAANLPVQAAGKVVGQAERFWETKARRLR
jgi:monoamine oxidase